MTNSVDHHLARAAAEDQVVKTALELALAIGYTSEHADSDAHAAYASDELAHAARRLVQAVDALTAGDQPVCWQDGATT